MIKDEENNKIIKEIEERVKIKTGSTDSFKIENKPLFLNLTNPVVSPQTAQFLKLL